MVATHTYLLQNPIDTLISSLDERRDSLCLIFASELNKRLLDRTMGMEMSSLETWSFRPLLKLLLVQKMFEYDETD